MISIVRKVLPLRKQIPSERFDRRNRSVFSTIGNIYKGARGRACRLYREVALHRRMRASRPSGQSIARAGGTDETAAGMRRFAIVLLLASCGSGSYLDHADKCQVARHGFDPITGRTYPDQAGSTADELAFLKGWSDD